MSNRVVALNSFVPPVRIVVSVMLVYRVVALMEKILTDYRLIVCGCAVIWKCFAPPRRSGKRFLGDDYAAFAPCWFLCMSAISLAGLYAQPLVDIVWKTRISLQLIATMDCFFFRGLSFLVV